MTGIYTAFINQSASNAIQAKHVLSHYGSALSRSTVTGNEETDKEHANFSCVSDVGIENYNRKPVWGKQKM